MVEATTAVGCSFEPAIDGIPGDSLYASNCGLVQALDAQGGGLIESGATVLESMIWRTSVQAKRLPASTATISTTPPPVGSVESMANDVSGIGLSRQRALPVWAAETPELRTWLGSAVTQAVDSNGTSGSLSQNLVRKRLDTRFWPDLKAKSRFSGKFDDVAMCRQSSLYHDCRPHVRRSGVRDNIPNSPNPAPSGTRWGCRLFSPANPSQTPLEHGR